MNTEKRLWTQGTMNESEANMNAKNYSNGFCWSSAPTENFIFLQSRERFLMRRILLFLVSYQFNQSAQDALQARCWKLKRYYKWDVVTSQVGFCNLTRRYKRDGATLWKSTNDVLHNLKRHLRPYATLFQSLSFKNQEITWGLRPVTCSRGAT